MTSFGGKLHPRVPSLLIDPTRPIVGIVRGKAMTRCKCVTSNDDVNGSPPAFWREGIRCPGSREEHACAACEIPTRGGCMLRNPLRLSSLITPSATIERPLLVFLERGMLTGRILPVATWRHRALQRGSPTPMPPQTKTNDSSLAN